MVAAGVLAAATTSSGTATASVPTADAAGRPTRDRLSATTWSYRELSGPARVQVLDGSKEPLATFTLGARTVTLRGAARTLAEPGTTSATVVTRTYVRLLPRPFGGSVDTTWLRAALGSTAPDVLAVALQYVTGAPTVLAPDGRVLSSDAAYGPAQPDGTRAEGSDFNDYLQLPWSYGGQVDQPEADQAGAVDCSGFVRLVLGYRSGVPLTREPDGVRLPRRAVQMLSSAPGVVTVADTGARPGSTSALAPGDLVFFDASSDDGSAVDHVGIYLGTDDLGAPRFLSSRKTVNGPTLGDVGGRSVLSGTGLYATSWRAARRL